MADLSPAEIAFFATGELPAELAAPAPAPAAVDPVAAPAPAPATPDPAAELAQQLEADRRRAVALEASIARLSEKISAPPPPAPAPAPPNPQTDPLGSMMHQLAQVTKAVDTLQQNLTQQTQQAAQSAEFTQFATNLQNVRNEFTKATPDFPDAYKHLRTARADDYRDVGVPEDQIARALLQDEIAVAQNAIAQGKNPAQVIYNMAKRYGYAAKAAPATPADKIAALNAGADAGAALPRAGAESALTLAGLKDAGDSDLNKLVQDDKQWARLVGNRTNDIF